MRSYRNPFRYRTSEQQDQQGLQRFLKTYGADVLDLLPEELWDRPLVIRSAPGGGKTSLLRAFEVETLQLVLSRPEEFDDLHRRMNDLGVIENEGAKILGARVSLLEDYRDLMDLSSDPDFGKKLFFRLLDANIVVAVCHAALRLEGRKFPDDLEALTFVPTSGNLQFFERLGGTSGTELLSSAKVAEREIRDLLDSVFPISAKDIRGHSALYSLRALSDGQIAVNGRNLGVFPLIMFDDGQELTDSQRNALFDVLVSRDLKIARWYTERYSALRAEEVVGDGEPGRAYVPLHLEKEARAMSGMNRRGRKVRPFESMLLDVADRRARKPLEDYCDEADTTYTELLDVDETSLLGSKETEIVTALRQRVTALSAGNPRYDTWIKEANSLKGYAAALHWRELEIVINRDIDRPQMELLDFTLDTDELRAHTSSGIRESAALFLRQEFQVPYYHGPKRLAQLGSQNVEQFLNLSAGMFEEMLALVTLGRRPFMDAASQDRIVRQTSNKVWAAIPERRSYGRDIYHLTLRIAQLSQKDTYRRKASYAPGVTGTALSMRDRNRLLDPGERKRIPGAEELFRALAGAIGHNLLLAELNRSVKNDRWMVLYLNRLLCAHFRLPLGYGGFRERTLEQMCAWMVEPAATEVLSAPVLFSD